MVQERSTQDLTITQEHLDWLRNLARRLRDEGGANASFQELAYGLIRLIEDIEGQDS